MSEAIQGAEVPTVNPASKLYPLDQNEIDIAITARDKRLTHHLRRPTLAELIERDQQSTFTTESVGSEEKIELDDETANARLWDKLALKVKGYRVGGSIDWANVDDLLRSQMPAGHKAAAIRGLYASEFTVDSLEDGEEGFALGDTTYAVKQTLGDYSILHLFRQPTEKERREFRQRASGTFFTRGKKVKTKLTTNLKAYTELYDVLLMGLDGTTHDSGEVSVQERARLVDPIWKRGAIDALMRVFEAQLSD